MGSRSVEPDNVWAEEELSAVDLGDGRLNRRAGVLLHQLAQRPERSIPAACQGWAETQAAYRFFSNEKVTAEAVLLGHGEAVLERARQHPVVLCVQDTTELDFTSKPQTEGLGPLTYESALGLYLHPTVAFTPERLCLGVVDLWTWVRDVQTHGTKDRASRASRPIEEKESLRWLEGYRRVCGLQKEVGQSTRLVYVADRESDLFELFDEGEQQGIAWLIRSNQPRKLADGQRLWAAAEEACELGQIEFDLPALAQRPARRVVQTLRSARLQLAAPYRCNRVFQPVEITALLAKEESPPEGVEPIQWLLLTHLPVETLEAGREKIQWYLCRWQIEVYFRVLKSGCKVEQLQLQTRDRLEAAVALYLIVAWRVLYLVMLGRNCPELPCDVVFATEEWEAIYLVTQKKKPPGRPPSLGEMVVLVARLGGFLARKGDGPPGPKSIWIGLQRARDFTLALEAQKDV
jgi:Transposase DNA-binding/Transposase Tn5 dimerisation domain